MLGVIIENETLKYNVYNTNGLSSTIHCFMQHFDAVLFRNIAFSMIVTAILSAILPHNNNIGIKTQNHLFNIVYSINRAFFSQRNEYIKPWGAVFLFKATILDAILIFPKRSMMPGWHHAVSELAWPSELETTIKFHAAPSSRLC